MRRLLFGVLILPDELVEGIGLCSYVQNVDGGEGNLGVAALWLQIQPVHLSGEQWVQGTLDCPAPRRPSHHTAPTLLYYIGFLFQFSDSPSLSLVISFVYYLVISQSSNSLAFSRCGTVHLNQFCNIFLWLCENVWDKKHQRLMIQQYFSGLREMQKCCHIKKLPVNNSNCGVNIHAKWLSPLGYFWNFFNMVCVCLSVNITCIPALLILKEAPCRGVLHPWMGAHGWWEQRIVSWPSEPFNLTLF